MYTGGTYFLKFEFAHNYIKIGGIWWRFGGILVAIEVNWWRVVARSRFFHIEEVYKNVVSHEDFKYGSSIKIVCPLGVTSYIVLHISACSCPFTVLASWYVARGIQF